MAWIATWGSLWPILFIIDRMHSLEFLGVAPALSQISIITSHCSVVLFSLVAFSGRKNNEWNFSIYTYHESKTYQHQRRKVNLNQTFQTLWWKIMQYYQNSINFFWIAIVFYRFGFQFSTVWYKISSVEMYSEENIDVFTKSWQSNLFVTNT